MTVHYIDVATLQRCKAAISCTRLIGRNTYDALASKVESFHRQFELCGQTTTTITDNGSNFVEAFKTFSVDSTTLSTSKEVIPQEDDSDQDEEDEEATFVMCVMHSRWIQTTMMTILKLSVNCHHMKGVQPVLI